MSVPIPHAVQAVTAVVRSKTLVDRCGPVADAVADKLVTDGIATQKQIAVVYGRFQHPQMTEAIPHTWLWLHTPHGSGDTTILDPTIKQFEAGYAPAETQLATIDTTFDTIGVFGPQDAETAWYTPSPVSMTWPHDGTPVVRQ